MSATGVDLPLDEGAAARPGEAPSPFGAEAMPPPSPATVDTAGPTLRLPPGDVLPVSGPAPERPQAAKPRWLATERLAAAATSAGVTGSPPTALTAQRAHDAADAWGTVAAARSLRPIPPARSGEPSPVPAHPARQPVAHPAGNGAVGSAPAILPPAAAARGGAAAGNGLPLAAGATAQRNQTGAAWAPARAAALPGAELLASPAVQRVELGTPTTEVASPPEAVTPPGAPAPSDATIPDTEAAAGAEPDVHELAAKLYRPLRNRLLNELRIDRERHGLTTERRR